MQPHLDRCRIQLFIDKQLFDKVPGFEIIEIPIRFHDDMSMYQNKSAGDSDCVAVRLNIKVRWELKGGGVRSRLYARAHCKYLCNMTCARWLWSQKGRIESRSSCLRDE